MTSAKEPGAATREPVVLGGLFQTPHLSIGYCRAARILLDNGPPDLTHLAPAIFFLLRHTVELALKDILLAKHEIAVSEQKLAYHTGASATATLPPPKWADRINRSHELKEILEYVKEDLPGYPTPAWESLVDKIGVHEKGAVEWSRYDNVWSRTAKALRPSFEPPQSVDLAALVSEAESFVAEAAAVGPEDSSALQDLGYEYQDVAQKLWALPERGLL